jgi:formate hydrogenlyase subunit 3/multisubunit Na+/H+ antiporter MnhD subunit
VGRGYFENSEGNKDLNKLLRFICIIIAFIGFVGMFSLAWMEREIPWYYYIVQFVFVLGAVYPTGIKRIIERYKK